MSYTGFIGTTGNERNQTNLKIVGRQSLHCVCVSVSFNWGSKKKIRVDIRGETIFWDWKRGAEKKRPKWNVPGQKDSRRDFMGLQWGKHIELRNKHKPNEFTRCTSRFLGQSGTTAVKLLASPSLLLLSLCPPADSSPQVLCLHQCLNKHISTTRTLYIYITCLSFLCIFRYMIADSGRLVSVHFQRVHVLQYSFGLGCSASVRYKLKTDALCVYYTCVYSLYFPPS